jgi:hypothetical protein
MLFQKFAGLQDNHLSRPSANLGSWEDDSTAPTFKRKRLYRRQANGSAPGNLKVTIRSFSSITIRADSSLKQKNQGIHLGFLLLFSWSFPDPAHGHNPKEILPFTYSILQLSLAH